LPARNSNYLIIGRQELEVSKENKATFQTGKQPSPTLTLFLINNYSKGQPFLEKKCGFFVTASQSFSRTALAAQ